MRLTWVVPLVAGLGCAAPMSSELRWRSDLEVASREAKAAGKPLLVLSIVGDLKKRC